MADAQTIARVFDLGFQRDKARDELPSKVLWRCVDFLPALDNALRKRGGWGQGSGSLSAVSACNSAEIGGYGAFPQDEHVLVFADNGKAYAQRKFDSTAPTLISATGGAPPTCPPFWHRDRLIVPAALLAGVSAPQQYRKSGGGYVLENLGPTLPSGSGEPFPMFTAGASWGEYLIGINGYIGAVRYPNRAWYSDVGDYGFHSSTSYVDFPEELVAVVPISNAQLFFGYQNVHVVLNDTPPPDSNFTVRKNVYPQGCFSSRSILRWKDYAIWANTQGVWKADTASIDDLTVKGGINTFWRQIVTGLNWIAGAEISLGIYHDQLIVSVLGNDGGELAVLCYDLNQNYWYELTNFHARSFIYHPHGQGTMISGGTRGIDSTEELLSCWGNGPYLGRFSDIYLPAVSSSLDFDGSQILPYLETAYFKLGYPWLKRFRRAYLTYAAKTDLAVDHLLAVYGQTDLDGGYELLQYLGNQDYARSASIQVKRKSVGMAFKIEAQRFINDLMLYEFEIESHPMEGSR